MMSNIAELMAPTVNVGAAVLRFRDRLLKPLCVLHEAMDRREDGGTFTREMCTPA
jgi:hypothetical protein